MGWNSVITSDQELSEELLTSILQAAPDTLKLDPSYTDNLGRCLMAT